MHYHYFTLEQRESLERLIRSSLAGRPEMTSALERLRSPAFGVCDKCGADIPYRKLVGDPLQQRCAACLV